MEPAEEGQILQDDLAVPGQYHDPAYEWPGDGQAQEIKSSDSSRKLKPGHPVFRFVVLRSSILPAKQKTAVIDAYVEVQIGRDTQPEGSTMPRIRLKEMEVSKVHATAYWDGARKEWNVVDMGSMHGTYMNPGPSRAASIPRRLRHSDQLTIGSTTFEVHIHDNQRPCQRCTIFGHDEIPLFPSPNRTAMKRTRAAAGIDSDATSIPLSIDRDPKKALTMLKRSLLTRHDVPKRGSGSGSPVPVENPNEYVDRAARRRLLHPASRPDTPGVSNPSPTIMPMSGPSFLAIEEPLPKPVSQPPTPLPSTNVGHRLLMQQGWAPGTALGAPLDPSDDRVGLIDPLEVKSSQHRAGLGMKQPTLPQPEASASGLSWKEREKFKRFGTLT
ncbi:hypothetical protein BDZ97DRAFT_1823970 [Flammula alnicola]|nr:hypothetical protein BDZ97DRAFT_1823970 [Flammula alnicola]